MPEHLLPSSPLDVLAVRVTDRDTEWVLRAPEDTGLSDEEWMARNEPQFGAVSTGGHFQVPHALFEHDGFEPDLDVLFDFGLRGTLDGIAVMIGETSA